MIYTNPYHQKDLSSLTFLVTGGAGFIGSNIVEYLLKYNAKRVVVLDNLSTGYIDNIKPYFGLSNVEFIEGETGNERAQNRIQDFFKKIRKV